MSFFLLPQPLIDSILFPTYPSQSPSIIQQQSFQISPPIEKNFLLPTTDALKALPSSWACRFSQVKWMVVVGSISQGYKTVLNLSFSKLQNKLHLSLSILNKAQSFFKITNSTRLVEILNKVNHYAATRPLNILTINIDVRNNKINIQLPFLLLNNPFLKNHIKSIYAFCSRDLHSVLKFIVSCCRQSESDVAHQGEQVNTLANLNKYSHILHVPMPYDDQVYLQKKDNAPFDRVIKDRVQIDECVRRTNLLLTTAPFYTSQNYRLSQSQLRYIQQTNQRSTHNLQRPQENTLNQIYLYNMQSIKFVKINEGGFCSIFQSDINYTPIDTAEAHSNRMVSKAECKKTVIFKKGERSDGLSRNEHQLKIVKTLANAQTAYLPKYYLIANKPNPFSKSLVMDYVSSKNLKDYMRLHSRYMSLKTKLTLIMGIIESLRFLESHCIVHLDLKPNNIMICPNLKVKLIDFGESYHHEVCSKGIHRPGYTIPYSPPQIFSNDPNDFTSKSDVFSLGVIMFQILYNTYPFDIFEDTSKIDDIMQCFLRKWFLCPQWAQTFGDVHIMRVVNMVICKCLSYDVGGRPELDWLAVMIRECIQIVK